VSERIGDVRRTIESDERTRALALALITVLLALAFMVLLISDQVQAAVS